MAWAGLFVAYRGRQAKKKNAIFLDRINQSHICQQVDRRRGVESEREKMFKTGSCRQCSVVWCLCSQLVLT